MNFKVNYIMRNGDNISNSFPISDIPAMEYAYIVANKMDMLEELIMTYEIGTLNMVKSEDKFETGNGIILESKDVINVIVGFVDEGNVDDE